MSEIIHLKDQDYSFFGRGAKLKGEFNLQGVTHIAGQIEGDITMTGKEKVTIEPSALINGTLKCHDIEIFGVFKGELLSTGKITVYPSATLSGKIQAQNISIHPGAVVNMEGKTDS
ncbi:MAG: polymer-forming cytoskeletal protein [Oligoflexia bacterium]|nr:polymer-forming cytoskeletal protein [Oligoflexia bacterium]